MLFSLYPSIKVYKLKNVIKMKSIKYVYPEYRENS